MEKFDIDKLASMTDSELISEYHRLTKTAELQDTFQKAFKVLKAGTFNQ